VIDPTDERLQARLLGRPPRELLTPNDRRAFHGASVIVTGGGGSIGSALALEVAACRPARLTIIDHSEFHLFTVERRLAARYPELAVRGWLADVTRRRSIERAFRDAPPDFVFHAAAYKHVTMCERAVCAAVRTNVFGALHAARLASEVGARFVLVSSDKAAQATSVMGATKRLAELASIAHGGGGPKPVIVRFGNVLGSRGSLLELVAERIREGLPVQVTHAEATRYFMTPREAVSLVMKAAVVGRDGTTYWLDMGAPVLVIDLVRRAMDAAVERGARAVPVELIGLRPGEKLREELTSQGLEVKRTRHAGLWAARQFEVDAGQVRRVLQALRRDVQRDDAAAALFDLRAAVPEFGPSEATWEDALRLSLTSRQGVFDREVATIA
jgi:O-antigen biosynthesis protein WbqV